MSQVATSELLSFQFHRRQLQGKVPSIEKCLSRTFTTKRDGISRWQTCQEAFPFISVRFINFPPWWSSACLWRRSCYTVSRTSPANGSDVELYFKAVQDRRLSKQNLNIQPPSPKMSSISPRVYPQHEPDRLGKVLDPK